MSDPVNATEEMESVGIVVKVDESKIEAPKSEKPLLPEDDIKRKRGRRKAAHTKLTTQLRKAVADHKKGVIRLTRLQVAAWRDELIRIYAEVKTLHREYTEGIPGLTDHQRQACEKWEVQFDTDHEVIIQFAIRYATSSSQSTSSTGTTHSLITTSEVASRKSTKLMLTDSSPQTIQREGETKSQLMVLAIQLGETRKQMEISSASSDERLNRVLTGMGEHLSKLLEKSSITTTEIAATTRLVRDSRQTLEALDCKIDRIKSELSSQVEGLRKETGDHAVQLKTLQREHEVQETSLGGQQSSDRLVSSQRWSPQPAADASPRRQSKPQSPMTSLEEIIQRRRGLLEAEVSSPEQPQRSRTFTYPSCDPVAPEESISPECSRTRGPFNPPPSVDLGHVYLKIEPFDGNPKNYSRFKAKFKALYERGSADSPILLFMLEELLSEDVRNEVGECLTDGTMYAVVWERLDSVYGRTEVMDQTYLDDLLQIPPLKNQEAGNLKTFANRLHGAVATLSQSKYAQELNCRTTLMAIEAKLPAYLRDKWSEKRKMARTELNILDLDDWVTLKSMSKQHGKNVFESLPTSTSKNVRFHEKDPVKRPNAPHVSTIGHVSTTEGSKVTAASSSATALPRSRPATEKKRAEKTGHWKCFVCRGKVHNLTNCTAFISLTPDKRAEKVFKSGRCLLCLTGNHERKECTKDVKCTIDGCTGSRHHTLLHGAEFIPQRKSVEQPTPLASTSTAFLGTATHLEPLKRRVRFKIVPIRIDVGKNWFDTYGFLDTGSDTTLIRSDVVKKLGIVGPAKRINVVSYDGATSNVSASVVKFSISSRDGTSKFEVKHAYAVDNLKVTPNLPIDPLQLESWTHLRGIEVPNVQLEEVTVLIGIDVAEAHDHVASIKPPAGTTGPIAFKTPFGWCLGGPTGPPHQEQPFIAHIVAEERNEDLNELVKKFWQLGQERRRRPSRKTYPRKYRKKRV